MPKLRSTGNPREPVHQDMSSTKGPAPSVPSNHRTHGHALPVLPNKPPNVNRSNSQVGNNKSTPKMTMQPSRQSPSVKPPPPPKVNPAMLNGVQPPLPSKPPNLNRRQSFGGNDVNYSKNSAVKSIANSPVFNTLKPPPPPRNNSVPNGLNNNVANTSNMLHSLPHPPAPPIPPPVSSIPSRGMKNVAHVAPMPQTPKMITRPHLGPPPPPPPHRSGVTNGTSYPAPPSQQRILAVAMTTRNDGPSHQPYGAPNPPIRNTSISRGIEYMLKTNYTKSQIQNRIKVSPLFLASNVLILNRHFSLFIKCFKRLFNKKSGSISKNNIQKTYLNQLNFKYFKISNQIYSCSMFIYS